MNLLCDGIVVGFVMENGVTAVVSRLMEKLLNLGCMTVGLWEGGGVRGVGEGEGRVLGVGVWGGMLGH